MSEEECNGNHWEVSEGQLKLITLTEDQKELAKTVIKVLEKQIRERIFADICSWEPLSNRRQILKTAGSMDAALLGVQAICADIALGEK